jgi:hypothetical protein
LALLRAALVYLLEKRVPNQGRDLENTIKAKERLVTPAKIRKTMARISILPVLVGRGCRLDEPAPTADDGVPV